MISHHGAWIIRSSPYEYGVMLSLVSPDQARALARSVIIAANPLLNKFWPKKAYHFTSLRS